MRARAPHAGSGAASSTPTKRILLPADSGIERVQEGLAISMADRIEGVALDVPGLADAVGMTFVGPSSSGRDAAADGARPPIVLCHGFDSNCLEFRRLFPLLEQEFDVYAVDILGWGFTDSRGQDCGPEFKRKALAAFIEAIVGGPAAVLGASLGGALAIDLAVARPDLVDRLILVDAQAFADGLGPVLPALPRFVTRVALEVLRSEPLRRSANQMSYFDKDKYATEDALEVGRLHCSKPDWISGNQTFIEAGGFKVSTSVSQVAQPTLVVWGEDDKILPEGDRDRFMETLPDPTLCVVPACGHVPHLEQPDVVFAKVKAHLLATQEEEG